MDNYWDDYSSFQFVDSVVLVMDSHRVDLDHKDIQKRILDNVQVVLGVDAVVIVVHDRHETRIRLNYGDLRTDFDHVLPGLQNSVADHADRNNYWPDSNWRKLLGNHWKRG